MPNPPADDVAVSGACVVSLGDTRSSRSPCMVVFSCWAEYDGFTSSGIPVLSSSSEESMDDDAWMTSSVSHSSPRNVNY